MASGSPRRVGIGDDRVVLEWTKADEEAFARSVLRRRWLNAMDRAGVVTVAQLRALVEDEERLRMIPNLGPMSLADISQALADPALGSDDPIELLALPRARPISERDQELVRMRQQGATLAQVARRFGISRTRVEQILERDGW
jgi:DNA-directed RNA polymerase specialized sigma subunit